MESANGDGINTEILVGSKNSIHSGTANYMWLSASQTSVAGQAVEYDLGRSANLAEMWVWNYNETAATSTRGIQVAKVFTKVNAGGRLDAIGWLQRDLQPLPKPPAG